MTPIPAKFGKRRPTLAIIVGAGASIAANAPKTADLLGPVLDAFPTFPLPRSDVARMAFDMSVRSLRIREAFIAALRVRNEELNYEHVLSALEDVLAYTLEAGSIVPTLTLPKDAFAELFDRPLMTEWFEAAQRRIAAEVIRRPLLANMWMRSGGCQRSSGTSASARGSCSSRSTTMPCSTRP